MSDKEKKKPWSKEEEREMEEDRAEHPWALTLAQFLDLVQRSYGFTYHEEPSDERLLRYLRSPGGDIVGLLPIGLRLEDRLDAVVTAHLCRHFRLPLVDFGLTGEDGLDDEAAN